MPAVPGCYFGFIFLLAVMLEMPRDFSLTDQGLMPMLAVPRQQPWNSQHNSHRSARNSRRLIQMSCAIWFEGGRTIHGWSDGMTGRAVESRKRTNGPGRPFSKGKSGNPAGRPPGRRATGAPGDRLPGSDQPTRAMILAEAYRPVTVGEGAEAIELPANQAVLRALTEAALKGNQAALRRWTQIVQEAEQAQLRDQLALYNLLERGCDDDASYDDDILVDSRWGRVVVPHVGDEDETKE
jgi:hypothetical protein